MLKDIRIFHYKGDTSIISMNEGTKKADLLSYADKAYVPDLSWRSLNQIEIDTLIYQGAVGEYKGSDINASNLISIVQIPSNLLSLFHSYEIERKVFHKPSGGVSLSDDERLVIEQISLFLVENYSNSVDRLVKGSIAANIPNLLTCTFDTLHSKFIGLHLDSWDRSPLFQRAASTNRICVNLGHDKRSFLFLNLSLMKIYEQLQLNDVQADINDLNSFGGLFFNTFPTYPIVSITLLPGEAYIAPTENCFHDGSTVRSTLPDITLTLRGDFWPNISSEQH